MNEYELTVVLPEKSTPAKKKSVKETIEKMVKTAGGKVTDTDEWGKIDLAQDVDDNSSGHFVHFRLELEPNKVSSIEQKVKIEEDIIRHLLTRREN